MTQDTEQYRAGFEAAARRITYANDFIRSDDGDGYRDYVLNTYWQFWLAAKRDASTEPSRPPGAQPCHACEGQGFINQCVICGSAEPRTGSCGSSDPRALCNFVAAGALSPELKAVLLFLHGEAPLDGIWFGERNPVERGAFWWRGKLRAAIEAHNKTGSGKGEG